MRPDKIPAEYAARLDASIDHWSKAVQDIRIHKFSELKCWIASIIGFVYTLSVYAGFPILLRNPAHARPGFFCSEIIDTLFREAGLLVAPRSAYPAVTGPVELLYSPYLSFQGIILNQDDKTIMQEELRQQYGISASK